MLKTANPFQSYLTFIFLLDSFFTCEVVKVFIFFFSSVVNVLLWTELKTLNCNFRKLVWFNFNFEIFFCTFEIISFFLIFLNLRQLFFTFYQSSPYFVRTIKNNLLNLFLAINRNVSRTPKKRNKGKFLFLFFPPALHHTYLWRRWLGVKTIRSSQRHLLCAQDRAHCRSRSFGRNPA